MDTSNFADEFTRLPLTDSPGLAPPTESLFRVNYNFYEEKERKFIVILLGIFIHFTNCSFRSRECS
jgi:hypothetical protein